MKTKNKLIIVILIFSCLLISLIYLKNNKDVLTKKVESNSNKYLISYNNYTTTESCNRYYEGQGTRVFPYTEVSEGFPLFVYDNCAVSKKYYLEKTEDDTNACLADYNYVKNKSISDKTVVDDFNNTCVNSGVLSSDYTLSVKLFEDYSCADTKTMIEQKYADYHGWKDAYNTNCKTTTGALNIIKDTYYQSGTTCEAVKLNNLFTGILKNGETQSGFTNNCGYIINFIDGYATTTEDYMNKINENAGLKAQFCDYYRDSLKNSFATNYSSASEYDKYCTPKTTSSEFQNSMQKTTNRSGKCDNYLNIYNGILAPTISLKKGEYSDANNCTYTVYYYKGQPWSLYEDSGNGILQMDSSKVSNDQKTAICKTRYYDIKGTNSEYDEFNKHCVDSGILDNSYKLEYEETIDVMFNAYNADEMECQNLSNDYFTSSTYGNNSCIYKFKKSKISSFTQLSSSQLPNTSKLKQLTTGYKFKGWRRTSETACNLGNININNILSNDYIEYVPCYDETTPLATVSYTLYNKCDGSYTSNNGSNTINKKSDVDNTPTIRNEIKGEQTYSTSELKSTSVSHGNSFTLNSFCTITCNESFSYNYPSIFETVKSGTYFDLLSYPEIYTQYTCYEKYNYDNWKANYDERIKSEKHAYVKMKNSQAINDLSFSAGDVCRKVCTSYDMYGNCTDYAYYYWQVGSSKMYNYNYGTNIVSSSNETFKYCEYYTNSSNYKSSLRINYDVNGGNSNYYSSLYNSSKTNRIDTQKANTACTNALSTPITNNFYNVKPTVHFYYESDTGINGFHFDDKLGEKLTDDELVASSNYVKDTGAVDWDSDKLYKEAVPININYDTVNENFTAQKTANSFVRTVFKNFIYTKSADHKEYYSEYQSGDILDSYISNSIKLGYVYPVSLALSGKRNIYFGIEANTNLNYGANEVLNNSIQNSTDKNVYQCDYDITNDIIVKDDSSSKLDDYKKNFYIRSVSTSDVDPNERLANGKMGENWSNIKGEQLIKDIEERAKNNNTYNPKYLEYSFVLNASVINKIISYNKTHKYDDNRLTNCNGVGKECQSQFLDELKDGNYGNAYAVMNRKTWKYFASGKWQSVEKLSKLDTNICQLYINDSKLYYDCIYRKVNEGVLP